jgi:hypothetical protein
MTKNKMIFWVGGMAQVVEHLHSKQSLKSSLAKIIVKIIIVIII